MHVDSDNMHIESEEIDTMHAISDNIHNNCKFQRITFNKTTCINPKTNKDNSMILENICKNELQEEMNTVNNLLFPPKRIQVTSKLYCLKRLYKKFGTKREFYEEDIINEFINKNSPNRGLNYEMAKYAAEKMCFETKILINDNGKFNFVSEEAFNIHVTNKLLKL